MPKKVQIAPLNEPFADGSFDDPDAELETVLQEELSSDRLPGAQLGFGFSSTERSKFLRFATDALTLTPDTKPGDLFLNEARFADAWYAARGYMPKQATVRQVVEACRSHEASRLKSYKMALARAKADGAEAGDDSASSELKKAADDIKKGMLSVVSSVASAVEKNTGEGSALHSGAAATKAAAKREAKKMKEAKKEREEEIKRAEAYIAAAARRDEDCAINVALFARFCTLSRMDFAGAPFPYAYAAMQGNKYRDLVGLLYYVPFLALVTFFFMFNAGGTAGWFAYKAQNDVFKERLFALECTSDVTCTEVAVKTLPFVDIKNRTEFFRWAKTRVVPELWSNGDNAPAGTPVNIHLVPVGALRIWQNRVDGELPDWQYTRYFDEFSDMTAQDFINIARLNTTIGGQYLASAPSISGRMQTEPYRQAEINASAFAGRPYPVNVTNAFMNRKCPQSAATTPYIRGDVGQYECDAYELAIPFNSTKATALEWINALEELNWIDGRTRGVFVSMMMFNKNTQLFTRTISGFEVSPGGYWYDLRRAYVFNFFTFDGQSGAWFFFYFVQIIFVIGFMLSFVASIINNGQRYMSAYGGAESFFGKLRLFFVSLYVAFTSNFWNFVDLATFFIFAIAIPWRLVQYASSPDTNVYQLDRYPFSLDDYSDASTILIYLESANMLLLYLKLFKYFKYFRFLAAIQNTIARCMSDLVGILFTAIVLLLAFAVAGYISYSTVLIEFSTFELTMITLLRFLVGDFNYSDWNETRRVVSPFYLAMLQIFLVIILVNAVTAVIADTFSDVSEETFDIGAVEAAARADPTSLITFNAVPPASEMTLLRELRAKILSVLRGCQRCLNAVQETDESRARSFYIDGRNDPAAMWSNLKTLLCDAYYGTTEEADAAVKLLIAIVKECRTMENNALSADWRFTMGLLSTTDDAASSRVRTLKSIMNEYLGIFEEDDIDQNLLEGSMEEELDRRRRQRIETLVVLFVFMPHHIARDTRGNSILELIDQSQAWKLAITQSADDHAIEVKHLNTTEKFVDGIKARATRSEREAKSLMAKEDEEIGDRSLGAQMNETMRRVRLEHLKGESSDDSDDGSNGDGADSDDGEETIKALDIVKRELRRKMLFRGMPKAKVEEVLDWLKGPPPGDEDDENKADEDNDEPVAVGGPVPAKISDEQVKLFADRWKTHHYAQMGEVEYDSNGVANLALGEVTEDDLKISWQELSDIRSEVVQTSLSFDLNGRQRQKMLDAFDCNDRLSVDAFLDQWDSVLPSVPAPDEEALKEACDVAGHFDADSGKCFIRKSDFDKYCQQFQNTPARRHFHMQYFATKYAGYFDKLKLALYLMLLAVYGYLVYANFSVGGAYVTSSLRDNTHEPFRSFEFREVSEIRSQKHFRDWVSHDLIERMYSVQGSFPSITFDDSNFLVGGINVRQLRARSQDFCGWPDYQPGPELDTPFYKTRRDTYFPATCTPRWWVSTPLEADINTTGLTLSSDLARDAFKYAACESGAAISGSIGFYGCDGQALFIPGNQSIDDARALLDNVFDNQWVDEHTRALTVDFFVYNFNYDRFARTQVLFEIAAGGAWIDSTRQESFTLFSMGHYGGGYFAGIAFFVIFMLLNCLAFIASTVAGVKRVKFERSTTAARAFTRFVFQDAWWLLELAVYLLLWSILFLRLSTFAVDKEAVRLFDPDTFPAELEKHSDIAYALVVMESITAFFTCARVFYFVRLNSRLNILNQTLELAANNMVAILVLSFVILIGFAFAGNAVYGTQVESMSSLATSFATLSLTFFGDDDFDNWFMAEKVFTGIYYALFTIVAIQVMFNMITSVLGNAYGDAKENQFNFTTLYRAIEVDPSFIEAQWKARDFVPDVVLELLYFAKKAYYVISSKPESVVRLAELRNRRTLYQRITEFSQRVDFGSPVDSACAAAQTLALIDTAYRLETDGNAPNSGHINCEEFWLKDASEHNSVFGLTRVNVRELIEELVGDSQEASISMIWCVEIPARFLLDSRTESIGAMLEYHHTWKRSLKKLFEEAKEDAELGDALREQFNRLDRATRHLSAAETIKMRLSA